MQIRSYFLLVAFTLGFVTIIHAQPKSYDIKNGFGIGGGLTIFDIQTDNFETKAGSGWMVQASATADLPHKWYNISYNIQLAQNKLELMARENVTDQMDVPVAYDVFTAQLGLVMHIKLIGSLLTLDAGPQLQYNGNLELSSQNQETFVLNGYNTLQAGEIKVLSKFNVNGMVGATAGFGPIKLKAQYMYGLLNTLDALNDQNLSEQPASDFEGNMSMLAFSVLFTF
ncbi:MAG: hypothetical protein ACWA5P_09560 [bacterium]